MHSAPFNLHDFTRPELVALLGAWDLSPVHAARLWNYLYYECADGIAAMNELPVRLRKRLETETTLGRLPVARETHSSDGFTRKYLLALVDGHRIETVLMRYTGRTTACVSSQVGCAMGCVFCATGHMGYTRHLTAGEIVAQAVHVDRVLRATAAETPALAEAAHDSPHHRHERLRNIVLMGMGEPLHNYDAVMKAIDILRDPSGMALGAKKISLSTVGVVPGSIRLADERRPFPDQAHAVGSLLKGIPAQVNLIPLNPTTGYTGAPSHQVAARRFQEILDGYGLPSTVRQRRGIDIGAGCGQLAVAE